MADPSTNPKTTLVELCQRYCGRSMDKADIVYTVSEFGGEYQAMVRIDCVDGQEFAGELCASPKEAEQAAACQALEGLRQDIGFGAASGKKRKASNVGEDVSKFLKVDAPDARVKGKLREACKQILGRDLTDDDIVYEVTAEERGQVATLTLPNLPGELGASSYGGTLSPFRRDTMLAAASAALDAILADPDYGPSIDLSKVPEDDPKKDTKKRSGSSGGPWACGKGAFGKEGPWGWEKGFAGKEGAKGWGKGKWVDAQAWDWMMSMAAQWKGKGKGKGPAWGEPMNPWSGHWGRAPPSTGSSASSRKQKKPAGGPFLPRERVTEGPVTGEVVEWKGKFGWIRPHEMVNHSASAKNQGRIWVAIQDIDGQDRLEIGSNVQFEVYADSSGLGAEEVVAI
mmetsp:Transcript_7106/g.21634  ORF Transcript_7106/g.21634 Transcript_7106/m.21634 type:complete len:398 (-) Transcript_7106:124-1317(-)